MVHSKTIKIGGRILNFDRTMVMGIVNLTPDSFYPDSRVIDIASVLKMVEKMVGEGADIIDLGAVSTRPGSKAPSTQTEVERILPALKAVRSHYPDLILSLDTYRSEVLRRAADVGIDLVNDISAGSLDPSFLQTVAELQLPYILMHMKGTPSDMQKDVQYDDLLIELLGFFSQKLDELRGIGIEDVIIDPGIGFGKRIRDNFEILRKLDTLHIFNKPLLIGLSRKSFIYKTLHTSSENALNGTTALHMLALQGGADILRVHDVRPAVECVRLWNEYCR